MGGNPPGSVATGTFSGGIAPSSRYHRLGKGNRSAVGSATLRSHRLSGGDHSMTKRQSSRRKVIRRLVVATPPPVAQTLWPPHRQSDQPALGQSLLRYPRPLDHRGGDMAEKGTLFMREGCWTRRCFTLSATEPGSCPSVRRPVPPLQIGLAERSTIRRKGGLQERSDLGALMVGPDHALHNCPQIQCQRCQIRLSEGSTVNRLEPRNSQPSHFL